MTRVQKLILIFELRKYIKKSRKEISKIKENFNILMMLSKFEIILGNEFYKLYPKG